MNIHCCFTGFSLAGRLDVPCGCSQVERLTPWDQWPGFRRAQNGWDLALFIRPGLDVVGLTGSLRGVVGIPHVAGLSCSLLAGSASGCGMAGVGLLAKVAVVLA